MTSYLIIEAVCEARKPGGAEGAHGAVPEGQAQPPRFYEYHVAYHSSYRVPVLMIKGRSFGK